MSGQALTPEEVERIKHDAEQWHWSHLDVLDLIHSLRAAWTERDAAQVEVVELRAEIERWKKINAEAIVLGGEIVGERKKAEAERDAALAEVERISRIVTNRTADTDRIRANLGIALEQRNLLQDQVERLRAELEANRDQRRKVISERIVDLEAEVGRLRAVAKAAARWNELELLASTAHECIGDKPTWMYQKEANLRAVNAHADLVAALAALEKESKP